MSFIEFKADLAKHKPNTLTKSETPCPFCNLEKLKKEGNIITQSDDFILIKNKFPVLKNTFQAVLIEHKSCEEHIGIYSIEYLTKLLNFALEQYYSLLDSKEYRSVVLFKNHGLFSGGSINHPHMQIVGLRESDYREDLNVEDFVGVPIISTEHIDWNISTKPRSEFYEFNILLKNKKEIKELATYIQKTVNYILEKLNTKYKCYNLAFYIEKNTITVKIFSRMPNSVLLLGFGIHQTPNNLEELAEELRQFTNVLSKN